LRNKDDENSTGLAGGGHLTFVGGRRKKNGFVLDWFRMILKAGGGGGAVEQH